MFHTNLNYDMSGRRRKKRQPKGEVYAKYKAPAFEPYLPKAVYRRETIFDNAPSHEGPSGSTARVESQKYTGSLVRGIATMHKSNAVPVISEEEATDISKMRR
jgi:hypothetical protein